MPKYEVYTPVHKGLRYALGVVTAEASALNFEDEVKLDAFAKVFDPIAVILHAHAVHEDAHIQPLVDKFAPELSERLEKEHQHTEELLVELEKRIQKIKASSLQERRELGIEWNQVLNEFVALYLNHLQTEEVHVQNVLWDRLTEEELINLTIAIRSEIPPDVLMIYFKFMIPAQNIYENVEMLGGMKKYAPPEAYKAACQLAEQELSAEYWMELKGRLEAI